MKTKKFMRLLTSIFFGLIFVFLFIKIINEFFIKLKEYREATIVYKDFIISSLHMATFLVIVFIILGILFLIFSLKNKKYY